MKAWTCWGSGGRYWRFARFHLRCLNADIRDSVVLECAAPNGCRVLDAVRSWSWPLSWCAPMSWSQGGRNSMTFVEFRPRLVPHRSAQSMSCVGLRLARRNGDARRSDGVRRNGTLTERRAAALRWAAHQMLAKEGVHNVHTLRFGFSCTDAGLVRIGKVFGGAAGFQGDAPGSSPASGTCFPCSGAC